MDYSILIDGNFSKPGWQGVPPPKMARSLVLSRYQSGQIKDDIKAFFPLDYATQPQLSGLFFPIILCLTNAWHHKGAKRHPHGHVPPHHLLQVEKGSVHDTHIPKPTL